MTENETCCAYVNIIGEHAQCIEPAGHTGWPHRNADYQLVWVGGFGDTLLYTPQAVYDAAAHIPGQPMTADTPSPEPINDVVVRILDRIIADRDRVAEGLDFEEQAARLRAELAKVTAKRDTAQLNEDRRLQERNDARAHLAKVAAARDEARADLAAERDRRRAVDKALASGREAVAWRERWQLVIDAACTWDSACDAALYAQDLSSVIRKAKANS